MSKSNTPATKPATEKAADNDKAKSAIDQQQAGATNAEAAGGGNLETGGATGAGPSGAQVLSAETDTAAAAVVDAALGGTEQQFTEAATAPATPPTTPDEAAKGNDDTKVPRGKKFVTAVNFGGYPAGSAITAKDLGRSKDPTGQREFDKQFKKGNIVEAKD